MSMNVTSQTDKSRDAKPSTGGRDSACVACGGTGWLIETQGTIEKARRCDCVSRRIMEKLISNAGIPQRYSDCCIDTLNAKGNDSLRAAKKVAQKFIDDYPAVTAGLLFIGPPGVGKTHLAVAILKEIVHKTGDTCIFYDYRDVLKQIQETYNKESQASEMAILEPVLTCRLLVLDEIGARRVTDWAHDTIFYILNQRYSNSRITIMTSNFPESKLSYDKAMQTHRDLDEYTLVDRIGIRLDSRLHEMCRFVRIEGEDYRKRNIQERYGSTG